jgi:hypothetical protein
VVRLDTVPRDGDLISESASAAARATRSDRSSRSYFQIARVVAIIVAAKAISANAAQGMLTQVSEEFVQGRHNYRLLFGHPKDSGTAETREGYTTKHKYFTAGSRFALEPFRG